MAILISLMRGINIGGHHEISMNTLRQCHEALGLTRVRTHMRSGNVVFDTGRARRADLGRRLEDEIETTAGFRPTVELRTVADLRRIVVDNPFKRLAARDPSHTAVLFLDKRPAATAAEALTAEGGDVKIAVKDREVFLYYPHGFEKARRTGSSVAKRLGVPGTARNWNTVTRLLAIAEEMEKTR